MKQAAMLPSAFVASHTSMMRIRCMVEQQFFIFCSAYILYCFYQAIDKKAHFNKRTSQTKSEEPHGLFNVLQKHSGILLSDSHQRG
jgi:hypothetical protein